MRCRVLGVLFLFGCGSCSSDAAPSREPEAEPRCSIVNDACVADEGAFCCEIRASLYDTGGECVRRSQVQDCWKVANPCLPNAAIGCFRRESGDGSTELFWTPSAYSGAHSEVLGEKCSGADYQKVASAPACGG